MKAARSQTNASFWVLLAAQVGVSLWPGSPNWLVLFFCALSASATAAFIWLSRRAPRAVAPKEGNDAFFIYVLFGPLALALRATLRFETIDWEVPLAVSVIASLPISYLIFKFVGRPRNHMVTTILFSIPFCFMGPAPLIWSTMHFTNALGVDHPDVIYRRVVTERHKQRTSKSVTYSVTVDHPLDLSGSTHFRMGPQAYEAIGVGDIACIEVFSGLLHIRWYHAEHCPA
ncbi:hypothetical protein H7F51_13545 [Novosphingobium flavum]|uniref:Uncharacterized protein n=1 Tax=Novosphingobium flavum TaxID=1778672 RepID=A0A7X1FT98_9SPHN|nr:hypothetical protein [Novosphingobium flavum]MBC2666545.1 hypothetical protein [Novosphingobium flavum]